MQGVRFSLRYKLLSLMSALLIGAISIYMMFAIKLFKDDKTAYIFENNSLYANSLSAELETSFRKVIKTLKILSANLESNESVEQDLIFRLLADEPDIVKLDIYEYEMDGNQARGTLIEQYINEEFFGLFDLEKDFVSQLTNETLIETSEDEALNFFNGSLPNGVPLLGLNLKLLRANDANRGHWMKVYLKQDKLLSIITKSSVYTTYLVNSKAELIMHPNTDLIIAKKPATEEKIVNEVLKTKTKRGAGEFQGNNKNKYIVSYSKSELGGLVLISQTPVSIAFLASQKLIEKTILFAVMLIGLFFVVSVVFSRALTGKIDLLYQATEKIAKGNFEFEIEIDSSDELGALSKSFSFMTKEIKRLLFETKEKARMDQELETAKLVQEMLFPRNQVNFNNFDLSAFYSPATECGGDWWGYITNDNQLVVMIGDATGHGAASALITAAAQSCCTTLAKLKVKNQTEQISPGEILSILNSAIWTAAQGKIKMTFFVSIIDMETGYVKYANASHEMPFICRNHNGRLATREDIDMLAGDPDNILGAKENSKYREYDFQLNSGDNIIWYTDGVTERKNNSDQEFGDRGLIKAICKSEDSTAEPLKEFIIENLNEYAGETEKDDDILLLVGTFKKSNEGKMAA